jgi:CotH kinase protein
VRLNVSSTDGLSQVVANLPPSLTTLPKLWIETKSGAPILSKDVYVDATYTLVNPMVSNEAFVLNGKIRGRGNVTWGQPKNPYKVQFANDANYAKITDVLGMKKNRNWALLADYFDKTLMRNKFAFALSNSALFNDGLKWNPTGQHLEVYLNNDYVGVYLLMEDIRIDPARLNIKKMGKTDVDGGYIVEADGYLDCYSDGIINLQHHTPYGGLLCIDTPDEESITPQQQVYIKSLIDEVEADLHGPKTLRGVNVASFADWYLLSELLMSGDQRFFSLDWFYSSVRMWKDTEAATNPADRLLNLGPIWDFDLSTHLRVDVCWISKSPWLAKMFEQPDFLNLTLARWHQKRPELLQFVNASLDTYARRLDGAQQRNFARWPVLGVRIGYGDPYLLPTYEAQVDVLKTWLSERIAFLDAAFASPERFNAMCR